MASAFNKIVPHVRARSPVTAANTSAATRNLEQRTNYLNDALQALDSKSAIIYSQQFVETAVADANAVFWNDTTNTFDQALAAVENNADTGTYDPTPSSECLGVAFRKSATDVAEIAIFGLITLTPTQIANLIEGEVLPGRYYLSATSPGKITRQRPPVTVAVGYLLGAANDCETNQQFLVFPAQRNFIEDHLHFSLELTATPAGTTTPPADGGRHEIITADDSLPGWLPADHESFDGLAPEGARFGYNLAAHPELQRIWPPLPIGAVVLEAFREPEAGNPFPTAGRVLPEFVVFDQNGIWWMTDCYAAVPWPTLLDNTSSSSATETSSASSVGVDCPVTTSMRLILSFLKMTFLTNRSVVTSLRANDNQPFQFVDEDGAPATTGDLRLQFALSDLITAGEAYGGQVLKTVSSSLKFSRGYVAEGLTAGSDRVILSGSRQRYRTPGDASTDTVHQGIVAVDVDIEPGERELTPQLIKLGDALEREYQGLIYIGFPSGRTSRIVVPFYVPTTNLPASPELVVRATLFGRGDGPWSEVTITYNRVAAPTDDTPTEISESATAVDFDVVTPSTDLAVDNLILVESDAFTVAAGDTVVITITREEDAEPEFAAEIGLVRLVAALRGGA